MRIVGRTNINFLAGLIASPIAVALTTPIALDLQAVLNARAAGSVRPFGIVYILVVALMSTVFGSTVGFLTLLLSVFAIGNYLITPSLFRVAPQMRDVVELAMVVTVGLIVIGAQESSRRAHRKLQDLLAKEKAGAEREQLMNRIAAAIRASLNAESVRSAAVAELGEALKADRCFIAVYDAAADVTRIVQDWHAAGLSGVGGEFAGVDLRRFLCEAGSSADPERRPGAPPRPMPEPLRRRLAEMRLESCLSAQIHQDDRSAVLLCVAMSDEPREWSTSDCRLLQSGAAITRSALEMARTHERELYIAQTLQQALMPEVPRRIPGLDLDYFYRACLDEASVGGDFADVFALEKGCFGFVVGDLSGKGLSAAIQVATVRNMVQYALYTGRDVAEAITRLNNVVIANNLLTGIATLFVASYDVAERTITYVSCGHEPGLLRRRATGQVELLCPTGPILGANESTVYVQETVRLAPGDAFALYTDGLTEAGPHRQQLLGVDGLSDIVRGDDGSPHASGRASELVKKILAKVEAYSGGQFSDDVCLLVGIVDG